MGTPGAILPILCRPASVRRAVALPDRSRWSGWPTGAEHDVERRALPPGAGGRVHGQAHRRGRARGRGRGSASCPRRAVDDLPEALDGAAFLDRWGDTDDAVTTVDPTETYPVRAATRFGVEEHARGARPRRAHLARGDVAALGPLLAASHAGYDAMGLGHPAATAAVAEALARAGVHGARSSGGGCGGTVVVLRPGRPRRRRRPDPLTYEPRRKHRHVPWHLPTPSVLKVPSAQRRLGFSCENTPAGLSHDGTTHACTIQPVIAM